jgi:hypothetical protein
VPLAMKSMISRYEGIAALLTTGPSTQDSAGATLMRGNMNGEWFRH